MRSLPKIFLSLLCAGLLLVATPARSIPTTTTGGTVLLGGTVVLVLYLAKVGPFEVKDGGSTTHTQLSREEAAALARAYLHDVGPALTQALASGRGPLVNDWAKALKMPPAHADALGALLHAHREELLELARPESLTRDRADRFFLRLAALIDADLMLASDLQALRASTI